MIKKKTTAELFELLAWKIRAVDYVIRPYAQNRMDTRKIDDMTVLDILENKPGSERKRNPSKDTFIEGESDWRYAIEGNNPDGKGIRIIITFDGDLMPIITVMWI